jgi:phosphoribosylglycinamide formyltransferase-1
VDESVDGGVIIMQAIVKILPGMDLAHLEAAVHKAEHKILPKTVKYFIENKIKIQNRRVILEE